MFTLHGANPENLYNSLNIPMPERVIDFSTNTNILTWPRINIDLEKLASSYPDINCTKLVNIIAEREHISPERILFTNGINQAVFLLSYIFGDDTAIFQPCYTEYRRAFRKAHDIFTLDNAKDFRHIIITNPNNPTGKFIPDLSRIIASFPDRLFIIDEAYIDFLIHYEPEKLSDFGNVIILRSLTKIFHLSGVRIGYVIAPEEVILRLKELMPSWSVNAVAQELALHFLNDRSFYESTRAFYHENVPKFMNALSDSGLDVMSSDVHYFLVRVDDDLEVIRFLLSKGIAVRHTRNFPGLEGKYIRVASRRPEENQALLLAIKELLSK